MVRWNLTSGFHIGILQLQNARTITRSLDLHLLAALLALVCIPPRSLLGGPALLAIQLVAVFAHLPDQGALLPDLVPVPVEHDRDWDEGEFNEREHCCGPVGAEGGVPAGFSRRWEDGGEWVERGDEVGGSRMSMLVRVSRLRLTSWVRREAAHRP